MSSNRGAGRGAALASLTKQLELANKFAPFPSINSLPSSRYGSTAEVDSTASGSGADPSATDSSGTKPRGYGRGKLMNDATSLSVTSQSKTPVSGTGPLGLAKLMSILNTIEQQNPPSSSTSETDSTAEAEEVLSKDSLSDVAEETALNKKGTKGMYFQELAE